MIEARTLGCRALGSNIRHVALHQFRESNYTMTPQGDDAIGRNQYALGLRARTANRYAMTIVSEKLSPFTHRRPRKLYPIRVTQLPSTR